jgi:hypothetical protein
MLSLKNLAVSAGMLEVLSKADAMVDWKLGQINSALMKPDTSP